jgi:DNA-directed RNA polymerase specialized sigma24 family protein
MKYSLGYEDKEIAEILNISHDKVRLQLHRARKQLKKRYNQEGV